MRINGQRRISTDAIVIIIVSAAVVYLASGSIAQKIVEGTAGNLLAGVMEIVLVGFVLSSFKMIGLARDGIRLQCLAGILALIAVPAAGISITTFAMEFGLVNVVDGIAGQAAAPDSALELVLAILAFALVTPIAEELVFRGSFYGALAQRTGFSAAAVLSSIAFALVHGVGPMTLVAFFAGLALCAVYAITDNLALCIFVHIVNNIFSLTGGFEIPAESLWFLIAGSAAAMVICLAALLKIARLVEERNIYQ